MSEETFLCQKYEDLIEHVRAVAKNPDRDTSPMRKQAISDASALQPSAFNPEEESLFPGSGQEAAIPVDDGIDPYALNDAGNQPMSESMFAERDATQMKDGPKTSLYDLNLLTQLDADQNSADIENFINEGGIEMQENESEVPKNDFGEAMSQGYGGDMGDLVNYFYGSSGYAGSKVTHGLNSQMNSQHGTNR